MSQVRTFCRICEPLCGLLADVQDGVLVKLTPDRDHPVTKGFACHKGLAAVDVNRDPDRLDHPLLRDAGPAGGRRAVSWDEAMAWTAPRLQAIVDEHGPNAVSAYVGNPTGFNALATLHLGALLYSIGVSRTFSSGTQDCANKFVASEAVFGTATVHPIPDLEHTDLCLIIGENPRASQASFYSIPNVLGELRRATARGARIVFVNPRRIETPDRGVGDTVLIRPDTDVWFSRRAAERDRPRRVRRRRLARHGSHVAELRPSSRTTRRAGAAGHRRAGGDRSAAGGGVGGTRARCTRRPASTWAARARSPTGWCTCCRSSPAASTSRAATSRATASTPTPGPAPACGERLRRHRVRAAAPGACPARCCHAILDSDDPSP
jgi:hypothetical protein